MTGAGRSATLADMPPLLAIIGPSAAGKTTLARRLAGHGISPLPTWTTRPPRPGETPLTSGHWFCDEAAFDAMQRAGRFACVGTLPATGHRYALAVADWRGRIGPVVMVGRATVVEALRRIGAEPVVYAVSVPEATARIRLGARGQSGAELAARVAEQELEAARCRRLASRSFDGRVSAVTLAASVAAAFHADIQSSAIREETSR